MKKIIFIILSILFLLSAKGQKVALKEIKTCAKNYFSLVNGNISFEIDTIYPQFYNGKIVYYIVTFNPKGYVVVSNNKSAVPIISYSTNKRYSMFHNSSYIKWMERYSYIIDSVNTLNVVNEENQEKWDNILKNINRNKIKAYVLPLIKTHWGQGYPYNKDVPSGTNCNNNHCYAGCVATAMAQIIRYWNYPVYSPLEGFYDYCNMPAETGSFDTETKRNAVAKLMHECGILSSMNYCFYHCESFAWPVNAKDAFNSYFNYYVDIVRREWYSKKNWIKKIKNSLDNKYPVLYFGLSGTISVEGHAFVVDGYNSDDKFHINWGWEGYDDGWFDFGAFESGGDNFNHHDRALINLHPKSTTDCNNTLVVFNEYKYLPDLVAFYYYPIAGTIKTGNNIIITSTENVHYRAYDEIVLENFATEDGAEFTAEIVPCPMDCGIYTDYKQSSKSSDNLSDMELEE